MTTETFAQQIHGIQLQAIVFTPIMPRDVMTAMPAQPMMSVPPAPAEDKRFIATTTTSAQMIPAIQQQAIAYISTTPCPVPTATPAR